MKEILIIVEKPTCKDKIEKVLKEYLNLEDFKKVQIYSILDKKEIFNIEEKIGNKKFCLSRMNEFSAKYSTNEYFPFNNMKFNYSINNLEQFSILEKLVGKADLIINACSYDKIGDLLFSSLIYSGYFSLKNKKIRYMKLTSYIPDDVFNSFLNLKKQKTITKKLKKQSPLLLNIEFEIAALKHDWNNTDLESIFVFDNKILNDYSLKYKLNLKELFLGKKRGQFTGVSNKNVLKYLVDYVYDQDLKNILNQKL